MKKETQTNYIRSDQKRPVGRPPVDRHDKFIRSFETTTALDNRLLEIAERKNLTVSALIREILEKYFENRDI